MVSLLSNVLLEKAAAAARSRSSWNDRLAHWERPASDTEEAAIARAAGMVRAIVDANTTLKAEGVSVAAQGSYFNNTNVRIDSDMDLRVVHPLLHIDYTSGVFQSYAKASLGISDSGRTFAEIRNLMRDELVTALGKAFGRANVDTSGKKAIRVKGIPGARAPTDVVPAFRHYRVTWNAFRNVYETQEGIAIFSTDDKFTVNFPDQHFANGVAKRRDTKHRFKRNVRMLKQLAGELEELKRVGRRAPSFLVECLTYAIENDHFLIDADDRYDRLMRITNRMCELLSNDTWAATATEINGIKPLFSSSQAWTHDEAELFATSAWLRLKS
jgi:hypothetical protein